MLETIAKKIDPGKKRIVHDSTVVINAEERPGLS